VAVAVAAAALAPVVPETSTRRAKSVRGLPASLPRSVHASAVCLCVLFATCLCSTTCTLNVQRRSNSATRLVCACCAAVHVHRSIDFGGDSTVFEGND
jgi:hypothetical protein